MTTRVQMMSDPDDLFEHLSAMNEAGVEPLGAGIDESGRPFLAGLGGAYAEAVWVQIDSPWPGEVGYDGECDECGAQTGSQIQPTSLHYPLAVLVRTTVTH